MFLIIIICFALICSRLYCFFSSDESILLDLKHLLIEAKQKVPEFLATLQSENEKYLNIGGEYRALFNQAVVLLCGSLHCHSLTV